MKEGGEEKEYGKEMKVSTLVEDTLGGGGGGE
jgi:hypothetical protein